MDEDSQTIRFSRYELPIYPQPDNIMDLKLTTAQVPTEVLREMLYNAACRPTIFHQFGELPRMTWWNRLKWEVDKWLPRVHCGPCNHEGCE